MVKGTIITLNSFEQQIVKNLGKQISRNIAVTGRHRRGTIDPNQTRESAFMESFASEMCFCKGANIYPDLAIHDKVNPIDCSYLGNSIDVKQTKYRSGHLLVDSRLETDEVDVYVLMIGTFSEYEYKGWAYKNQIIKPELLGDPGNHGNQAYLLGQNSLNNYLPERK